MSNPKLMPGHLLVIPKRHVEKLSELKQEEKKELIALVIKYQELVLAKMAAGCDIRQNHRPFIKEGHIKVNHLHIHLLPRKLDDELHKKSMIYEKEIFKDLTPEEIEDVLSKLN